MELEQWLQQHPPTARGLKAHAAALHRMKSLGYTQEQMRGWLATQGLTVSRQAISKFFLPARATAAQPPATPGNHGATARATDATQEQPPCNIPTNRSAAPPPAPAEAQTLRERAQAVGDHYLQQTLSPLAAQLLSAKPPSKT